MLPSVDGALVLGARPGLIFLSSLATVSPNALTAEQEKGPEKIPGLCLRLRVGSVVHAAHTAHTTPRHGRRTSVLLWPFGHHGFRGDQEPSNRRCILQRRPHNLGWIDDALADEIDVFEVLGVEAVRVLVLLKDLADDDRTVFACIDGDLARRPGKRLAHDFDAGFLVVVLRAYLL